MAKSEVFVCRKNSSVVIWRITLGGNRVGQGEQVKAIGVIHMR